MDLRRRHDDHMDHMGGTATSTADMGTSTSSMDHGGGHDHMSGGMDVIFITSSRTALFWSVSNAGHYAGSCIFLIVLGCLMRFLLALRPILETRFWGKTAAAVAAIRTDKDSEEESQMLPAARPGQALAVLRKDVRRGWSGWRVSTAAWRAMYDLVIAGIGYLLMLAVMTMNVGYFLSVLAGIWLGAFLLGNLSYDDRWSHC